jgi:hypothetical protein
MRAIASRSASTLGRERRYERVIWNFLAILLSVMPSPNASKHKVSNHSYHVCIERDWINRCSVKKSTTKPAR